jgi:hypothetical protein
VHEARRLIDDELPTMPAAALELKFPDARQLVLKHCGTGTLTVYPSTTSIEVVVLDRQQIPQGRWRSTPLPTTPEDRSMAQVAGPSWELKLSVGDDLKLLPDGWLQAIVTIELEHLDGDRRTGRLVAVFH